MLPDSRFPRAAGTLFVVATPIGNLRDITSRALEVLAKVNLIASEDTRTTRKLLAAYSIRNRVVSYHEQGGGWETKARGLLETLLRGQDVALVSEAGTPGISDPGYGLVRLCIQEGITVQVVPGASAILAALIASGLPANRFAFEGFLPRRSAQRLRLLESLREETRTMVFFESPKRLASTLAEMAEVLGNRQAAVARELTKAFEEVRRGALEELAGWARGCQVMGEVTLVVAGCPQTELNAEDHLRHRVRFLMERRGLGRREVIKLLERETGLSRKTIYRAILEYSPSK
ncbi:MAG: 16S rRNA (cytidine(1402)-2'-O)-methyltransferase [Thermodesulfobacteriota bacterium]